MCKTIPSAFGDNNLIEISFFNGTVFSSGFGVSLDCHTSLGSGALTVFWTGDTGVEAGALQLWILAFCSIK